MTSLLYQAYQNHADLTAPWRTGAAHALKYLNLLPQGISDKFFRRMGGPCPPWCRQIRMVLIGLIQ